MSYLLYNLPPNTNNKSIG